MSEHTPLPLTLITRTTGVYYHGIGDGSGKVLFVVENKDLAEYIVKACNAYPKLVNMVRFLQSDLRTMCRIHGLLEEKMKPLLESQTLLNELEELE